MIIVTGATGYVGRLVAEALADRREPMRTREPARAPRIYGAQVAQADYGDPASLDAALGEGDRVVMVSVHEGPERRVPVHRSFVESAVRNRVGALVYLSFLNAGPDATFLHARSHGATEAMLRYSGLPCIAIRNGMHADKIPDWVRRGGG
jgi:NAD(P)H dehydrogenase (quinone)